MISNILTITQLVALGVLAHGVAQCAAGYAWSSGGISQDGFFTTATGGLLWSFWLLTDTIHRAWRGE